jgi:glycosyltransferase 2 family protein
VGLDQKEEGDVIKKYLGWTVLFGVLVWFGWTCYAERDVLAGQVLSINTSVLLVSLLVLLTVFFLQAIIWRSLLCEFGYRLSFSETIQTLYISSLGRYVPGRIWQFSSAVYLLHALGVPPETAGAVSILSQSITIAVGVVVSLPILTLWLASSEITLLFAIGIFGAAILLISVAFLPVIWLPVVNRILQFTGRTEIVFPFPLRRLWKYGLLYLIVWVGLGFAFYLLVYSVYPLDQKTFPLITGSFAFAYIVGYLLIFTPGGLGAREGALVVALTLFLPVSVATLVSILSRFWMISVELTSAGVALWLRSRKQLPHLPNTKQ